MLVRPWRPTWIKLATHRRVATHSLKNDDLQDSWLSKVYCIKITNFENSFFFIAESWRLLIMCFEMIQELFV